MEIKNNHPIRNFFYKYHKTLSIPVTRYVSTPTPTPTGYCIINAAQYTSACTCIVQGRYG